MNDTCICDNVPKVWRLTGVTRTLRLRIFNPDGTPLDLTGRTVGVTIARDNSEFVYAPGFVIEGDDNNVVKFEWPANQQWAGDYTINVTTTDGSGNADRVNWHGPTGIRLVDFSFMVRGEDALGVTSEANIGLDGTFTMNGTGMSAYDEWLAEGHTGTPEDFIVWLRQPAEDAATEAEATVDAKMAEVDADMAAIEATAAADHTRAENDHTTATGDHTTAASDHTTAAADHTAAAADHTQAGSDHTRAEGDHTTAASDHTQAAADHTQAASDHSAAASDHTRAGQDHTRSGSDHEIAVADHAQAEADHTRAESDHGTAAADHTQAGADHSTAAADHTLAASDHSTAAEDHTQALADHAVMEGYDTRLTNVEEDVSQLGQKLIHLTGFGTTSAEAGAVNSGDIYYNTNTKLLRKCTGDGGTSYETVPYLDGAIYTYNECLYVWNGTELVSKDKMLSDTVFGGEETNYTEINGIVITNENIYKSTSGAGGFYFPITPLKKYIVSTRDNKGAIIAILKSIDNVSAGQTPLFSDSYLGRIVIPAGETYSFRCPEDARFMYMLNQPSGENYGLGILTVVGVEETVSGLEETVSGLEETVDITFEYGQLTGNTTSSGNQFDCNMRPVMKADANSFHQYSRSRFITARKKLLVQNDVVPLGILLLLDESFSLIGQTILKKENLLPNAVRYVKMCLTNPGQIVSTVWSQGSVDTSGSEANRIKCDYIPFGNIGTVVFDNERRLALRFYDSSNNLIGNSLFQVGIMITRGQIINAFAPTSSGKTIDDVAYMRFMVAEKNSSNLGVDAAPTIYAPGMAFLDTLSIHTVGGKLMKDRNDYNKTFRLVYDTPVNHLAEDASTTRYYSTMMLRLPMNYTQDGTPTRLIIFKSGSRSFDEIFEADFLYLDYIKYWVDQGYAVMDYFGGTSKYPTTDSFGFATNIASANAAYDFLVRNFNIDKGGVYLSCKSLGGYTTHELIFNGTIPIKAAAMLAPGIDNKRYCFGYYGFQRLNFAADMGFTGDLSVLEGSDIEPRTDITIQYSDAFKTLLTNNIDKVYGFLPMFNGVINKTLAELLDLHTEVADAWADVKRIHRVPTRYWVAPDDTDTPYPIAANYVKSCQNAFCPVTLRTMPSGTGGHHSVDNAENAPKVVSITTRLGVTYTNFPLAFVEALNFLERY